MNDPSNDSINIIKYLQENKVLPSMILVVFGTILMMSQFGNLFSNLSGLLLICSGIGLTVFSYLKEEQKFSIRLNERAIRNKSNAIINSTVNNALDDETIKLILEKEGGKYIELLNFIESYKQRLNNHIESLVKNRNLNLIIGLLITFLSIFLLLKFFILDNDPKQAGDLVFYYTSRFTVVVSIEIFSLFFLKLYSANLAEIKYFQNELSNVESKIIALKTAMLVEQPELIAEVVKELVKTERNYILRKDETTVDLERTKLDKEDNKHLLDSITQIIKDIKSK